MRSLLMSAVMLATMALMPSAPVSAAGLPVTKPDTTGLTSNVVAVKHRHHRHHRHYHARYRWPHHMHAYRYHAVPRADYRPYYYSAWTYPYSGVYVVPHARHHWRYRHW